MRTTVIIAALLAAAFAAGCAEKPQTADATVRKPDEKAWNAASSPYVAQGWKAGDQASWEQQMRARAQAQNEYARAPAQP